VFVKNRLSLALITLLLFALSLPAFVFAQQRRDQSNSSAGVGSSGKVGPTTGMPGRRPRVRTASNPTEAVKQDFSEALEVIQEHYIDGNKLDYNNVYKSSIMGMLRTLDPHSTYFDKEEFDEFQTDQRSEYFGIGASINNYAIGDQVETYVVATFPDSPANRAGLRFGDRIDEVDGVPMHGKSSSEVRDKIRGPRGTQVKVTVTRAATGKTEVVQISRDAVSQPSVPDAYMISPGVGYIDMRRGFNLDTSRGLNGALAKLHSRNMRSLVLDLRDNPGGFLQQAKIVAQTFLPSPQLILTQKGRDVMNDQIYRSENSDPDRTPLVILVNENTASASEIVAGALQDHDRALIVGQTSFGKGLVQSIIPLDYGAGLTLTSAKYYTPSGRLIQRDYSNGDYYNYIFRGGIGHEEQTTKPVGPASRTDIGRPVYGGGGITPDEQVKAGKLKIAEVRLRDPLFLFTRELVNGRIAGFDKYKIDRIEYDHDLVATDFPVTDALYNAFKDYLAKDANWKTLIPQLDRSRSFINMQLRTNIITAAYGTVTATRVVTREDPQVEKAIEVVPRARDLAMAATRARMQP
jgi:carboxyl-terminal processing protease